MAANFNKAKHPHNICKCHLGIYVIHDYQIYLITWDPITLDLLQDHGKSDQPKFTEIGIYFKFHAHQNTKTNCVRYFEIGFDQ